MDKICKSVTHLYRLPRIGHLNLRLNAPVFQPISQVNASHWNYITTRNYASQKPPSNPGLSGAKVYGGKHEHDDDAQNISIVDILEREIQDESAELNQHLLTDQFPGFSVETDGADVKLTKQVGDTTVSVRFTVSSSLSEWPTEVAESKSEQKQESEGLNTTLMSMPEFQVQIGKNDHTLEISCYFEEMEQDEETGEPFAMDPVFSIDELVMYQGEPKETEFAVSAEYFQEDLQAALLQYLGEHGIDDDFAKNLVGFSTSYEKKQYIGLMKRLKSFVSK